jgi:hypothetical protein
MLRRNHDPARCANRLPPLPPRLYRILKMRLGVLSRRANAKRARRRLDRRIRRFEYWAERLSKLAEAEAAADESRRELGL